MSVCTCVRCPRGLVENLGICLSHLKYIDSFPSLMSFEHLLCACFSSRSCRYTEIGVVQPILARLYSVSEPGQNFLESYLGLGST